MNTQDPLDPIRKILADVAKLQREFNLSLLKSREKFDRSLRKSQEKSDRFLRKSQEKSDRFLRKSQEKSDRFLQKSQEKLTRSQEVSEREMRQLHAEVREVSKSIGYDTGDESLFLEDEFCEGLRNLKKIGPVKVSKVITHMKLYDDNYRAVAEFDLVIACGSKVLVGEIKRKVRVKDVKRLAKEQLPKFAKYNPRKTGELRVFGMIGGVSIPDNAAKAAAKYGMFVLRLKNRKVLVENTETARAM